MGHLIGPTLRRSRCGKRLEVLSQESSVAFEETKFWVPIEWNAQRDRYKSE